MSFLCGNPKINAQIFGRKPINDIFEPPQPKDELGPPLGRDTRRLVSEIGRDIAVQQDGSARVERCLQFRLCFKTVASVEERRKMGVHRGQWAELSIQKTSNQTAKAGFILGETK